MSPYDQYQNYRSLSVNTLTPEELLILLYEELSVNINKAILSIKNKKTADAHSSIIKAENIILYLIDILDLKYPISAELLKIYEYIYRQLINSNISKDDDLLKKILSFVNELKTTWQKAEKEVRQKANFQENIYEQ